ncbi:Yip1 family protein [Alteromonadaceae bacterium BrNp21-10]|nr:Yip1 family protein [Alteromonadaceae bacterium BrNp21-10]
MILNHLLGLYTHPKEEWQTIDKRHESLLYSMSHILIVALIPSLTCYYSAVHLGWSIGVGDPIILTQSSAMIVSTAMYLGLVGGVIALAALIHWMAKTFGSAPSYTQSLELAAYAATPLFMVGFASFYPVLWFVMLVGLAGLSYSIYLLYAGVPIIMHIPEERGFIYSSTVVTCGLILLVVMMTSSVMLWSLGLGPVLA